MRVTTKNQGEYPLFIRPFFWNQKRKYGAVLQPALLWARVPQLFASVALLYGALDRKSSPLDPVLRSLVTVRVSQINWCNFCTDINSSTLKKRNYSQEKIDAIPQWQSSDLFDEREKSVLQYTDAVTHSNQHVTDEMMESIREFFDEDAIVELTGLIAFQNLSSKFNSALDVPSQGFCKLPDITISQNTTDTSNNSQSSQDHDNIRQKVRESYMQVAQADNNGDCCGVTSSCCGVSDDIQVTQLISTRLGYSNEDLNSVPEGADMGLGCGNPKAIAALKRGETVVDLGSGGGFDVFLAANEVGDNGSVIGIDMTPDMISKARKNSTQAEYNNVEFRLGEIEHIPVADNSVDVIMSNCVINLSPNKQQVFNDAYRILRSGGRLAISDVVSSVELPEEIKSDSQLYSACVSGASTIEELKNMMQQAGFKEVKIEPKDESKEFIKEWSSEKNVDEYVVSASIQAVK